MNLNLPLALAVEFKAFTPKDIVIYSIFAAFFIIFAVYYKKKSHGDNLGMVRLRKEYVTAHPDLSAGLREAILSGSLIEGMDEELIVAAIGHPRRTQILTVEPVRSEVWIYRNGIYAYVHQGILQKWKIHHKFISFS